MAALNTPIKIASSKIFLNVLKDTFKTKNSTDFLLPKLDLSQLFSQPASSYLKTHHANILFSQRVKSIAPHANGYKVSTKEAQFEASHVIVAMSPVRLRNVLGRFAQINAYCRANRKL